jgi:hypothetical protein
MEKQMWRIDAADWTLIPVENATFILEEAKDMVAYTIEINEKISARAFSIFSILLPITSALIAVLVNEKLKPAMNDAMIIFLLFFIISGLIIIMYGLGKIIFPRDLYPSGREPRQVCIPEFLAQGGLDATQAKLAVIVNEIENCQLKISGNNTINTKRIADLKMVMMALGLMFALSTLILAVHFIF